MGSEQPTKGRNPFKAFWRLVRSRSMAEQIVAGILAAVVLASVPFVWNRIVGEDSKFLNPGDGATINLCPHIDGVAPAPADGSNYYVVIRHLDTYRSHYRLAARVIISGGGGWKIAAPIDIGAKSNNENGRWQLLLVLADKHRSVEYEGRFATAERGEESAKELGANLPPSSVEAEVEVIRTSYTCP
jgi:hypothetical protein